MFSPFVLIWPEVLTNPYSEISYLLDAYSVKAPPAFWIILFKKYVLNAYYVPGPGLGKNVLPPMSFPNVLNQVSITMAGLDAATPASPVRGQNACLATPSGQ